MSWCQAITPMRERLLSKTIKVGDCWEWTGRLLSGYGSLKIGGYRTAAHRLSYETFVGPIPPGLFVCHTCDNPACINPAHLWLGTNRDNIRDAAAKGRLADRGAPAGEINGQATLTAQKVREIREKVASGVSQYVVADQYHINQGTVSRLHRRVRWAHVG